MTTTPTLRRDRIGAGLLYVAALGATASAVGAVWVVADAGPETRAVETWRLVGYLAFAGLFVLLARAPRQLLGLWEVTIAAKLALPLAGATFLAGADEAGTFVVADGVLVVLLAAAYVLTRGWTAAPPGRHGAPPAAGPAGPGAVGPESVGPERRPAGRGPR